MKIFVRFITLVFLGFLDYFIWINLSSPVPVNILMYLVIFNVLFLWAVMSVKTKQEIAAQPSSELNKKVRFWAAIPGLFIIGFIAIGLIAGTAWTCSFAMSKSCGHVEFLYIIAGSILAAIFVIFASIKWKKDK
jgi:hypothetical protein